MRSASTCSHDPDELKNDVDALLSELNETPVAEGHKRVLWAGQKEQEAEARSDVEGVPLSANVVSQLKSIGKELGIVFPLPLSK